MRKTIAFVVGARPNFVKVAPVIACARPTDRVEPARRAHGPALRRGSLGPSSSTTSGFPTPDVFLGVGSGTHAEQTGTTLIAASSESSWPSGPTLVVVAGDVNSTLAAALAAAKLGDPSRAHRGGPSVARLDDARGDQPRPHRSALRPPVHAQSGGAEQPCRRRASTRPASHYVGNTMIDSLRRFEDAAAGAGGVDARGSRARASSPSSRCTGRRTSMTPVRLSGDRRGAGASSRVEWRWSFRSTRGPASVSTSRVRSHGLRAPEFGASIRSVTSTSSRSSSQPAR